MQRFQHYDNASHQIYVQTRDGFSPQPGTIVGVLYRHALNMSLFLGPNSLTMASSLGSKRRPGEAAERSTGAQVCFGLHSIEGRHLKEQAAVVCVNGVTFVLYPRGSAKHIRYYEDAYCVFIAPGDPIRLSVGVATPQTRSKGFLHCFACYRMRPPREAVVRDLTLQTVGGCYSIRMSLLVAPSARGSPLRPTSARAASSARARRALPAAPDPGKTPSKGTATAVAAT